MAKENFDRSKPHLNIGNTVNVTDTSGTLLSGDQGSATVGNPAPSSVLTFGAQSSTTPEIATVAFPIDSYFMFDPESSGDAESLAFSLDVLPNTISGTSNLEIAFTIIQDEPFVATRAAGIIDGTELDWTTFGQTGLEADDFMAVDGGTELPDFSRPFQFGYAFTGEYSTSALSVDLGLDNMTVEITTVPEPSSIALVAAMGASLLFHRLMGDKDSKK